MSFHPTTSNKFPDFQMTKATNQVTEGIADGLYTRKYTVLTITSADPAFIAKIEAAVFAALNASTK